MPNETEERWCPRITSVKTRGSRIYATFEDGMTCSLDGKRFVSGDMAWIYGDKRKSVRAKIKLHGKWKTAVRVAPDGNFITIDVRWHGEDTEIPLPGCDFRRRRDKKVADRLREIAHEQALRFGCILRSLRKHAGFTQRTLAEKAGTSLSFVSCIERGRYFSKKIVVLLKAMGHGPGAMARPAQ